MGIYEELTVSPLGSTTTYYVSKEDVAKFVYDITQAFLEILQSITITRQEKSGDFSVRIATRELSDATETLFSLAGQHGTSRDHSPGG